MTIALKFPTYCYLGFYDVTALVLLLKVELLLFETIGQSIDVIKSKTAAH